MNFLKKLFLFSVLALAVAWPLQPQRAGRPQRDQDLSARRSLPIESEAASAAAPAQWARSYSYWPSDSSVATAINQTTDGGYIMAGYIEEVDIYPRPLALVVVKLSSDGIVEWQTYLWHPDMGWHMTPIPAGIFQTSDGGFIVGGRAIGADYWLIKLTASGAVQWQRYRWGSGSIYCFQLARDGGFILAGYARSSMDYYGVWILKLGSEGEVEWQKKYHQEGLNEGASAVAQTPDGGYIVVGTTDMVSDTDTDLFVLKLDMAGGIEWQRCYSGAGRDFATSVQSLPDGSFIVAGVTLSKNPSWRTDALAMKFGADGSVIWCGAYAGFPSYGGGPSEIRRLTDGGFILICGWEGAFKIDANGNIIWQRAYGMGIADIQPTEDGGFIFAGGYDRQLAAFKTDSLGLIAGCSLIRDSGLYGIIPTLSTGVWSPTVTLPSAGSSGDPFLVRSGVLSTEAICLPYFELTIAAGPGGTTKPEPATHAYASGSSVKVYALPDERHVFSFWSGDVPEKKRLENPVRIDMDGDKSIRANFARPNFQLTIAAGDGGTTDPAPGNHTYTGDTVVKIEGLPDASHVFTSWTGDVPEAKRGDNPVMLEMDSNKVVQANFAIKRILRLSAGTGGTTEPTPGVYGLPYGATVAVKAVPDSNHVFSQWAGDLVDARKTDNPLSVLMDIDRTLAAGFLLRISAPLDLHAETRENLSLLQKEYINVLTWRANPKNAGIIKYRIYELRAGNLILLGEAAVGTDTYWHRDVEKGKTYTYVVKAVGENNREGDPATVTVTVS